MGCSADPLRRGYLRPAQGFDRSKGSRRKRSCRRVLPRNLAVAHEPTGLLVNPDARRTWEPQDPVLRCRAACPPTCVCLPCTATPLQALPSRVHGPRRDPSLATSTCDGAQARRRRQGLPRCPWGCYRRRRDAAWAVFRGGRGRLSRIARRCSSSGRTAPCCLGREGIELALLCTGRRRSA